MKRPNISFLRKVQDERVFESCFYTTKHGMVERVYGGEKTLKAHIEAGYVHPLGAARLGRPAYARLTAAGREALSHQEGRGR